MPTQWVTQVILGAATVLGSWLLHRLTNPKDHERAELLSRIAAGAAALVVSANPNADWALLLQNTISQIAGAAGLPTSNMQAVTRAAAEALTTLGKNPARPS